jgi:hypothetical protein
MGGLFWQTYMQYVNVQCKISVYYLYEQTHSSYVGVRGWDLGCCDFVRCVAVKCLNPNLLVPDGGMGSISKVSTTVAKHHSCTGPLCEITSAEFKG